MSGRTPWGDRVRSVSGGRRKLIVVSNRGPVTYGRDDGGERTTRRGGGGLVTALRGLVAHHEVTWIASAMSDEDRAVVAEANGEAVEEQLNDDSPFRLRLVAHDEAAYDWFYNVVSNPMLWFLQHYLWELAYTPSLDNALQHAWDEGYARVNAGFADAVVEELELDPDAAVFFHDYHLYLAPRLVREQVPDALLAHFVHIPWPQTDYWHVLPDAARRAIPDGLLADDVVGFHAHRWRQDIPEYSEYLGAIQREARRVNDRFHQGGWAPIDLVIEDNFPGALAAYKQFDVLFVNAIFDGLNLVAKEAPLVNERDGVVVLSENTGAHEELGEWVVSVNPFDVAAQAEALHEALTMAPDERRRRLEAIRAHVREHDVAEWIEAQLADLDRCAATVR